jgi:hypothetical protein
MTRRAAWAVAALVVLAGLATAPPPAAAQLGATMDATPHTPRGARPVADEAVRRTVTLVLRAVARRGALPPELTDPQPLSDEDYALLRPGQRISPDFPAAAVPTAINDRLPHVRGSSIWASAGTWLIEIDPTRMTILTVAPDVLPPDI